MSKRGREQNRQRRLIGASPGTAWTAARAAEDAVSARDDLVARTQGNAMLMAFEALNLARGVRLKQRASLEVDGQRTSSSEIYTILLNGPLSTLPPFPDSLRADYTEAIRHFPEADSLPEAKSPDGVAARIAVANTAKYVGDLRVADVYVVSPALHEAICAAARTVDQRDLLAWRTGDVIAESGFLLLPYTQKVEVNTTGSPGSLSALKWRRSTVYIPAEERRHASIEISELGPPDHTSPYGLAHHRVAQRAGHPLPRLNNQSNLHAFLDVSDEELATVPPGHDEHTMRFREALSDAAGFGDVETTGEHEAGAVAPDPAGDFASRYLFCFMRLAEQRVATTSRAPAMHENGKRTRSVASKVRVVRLRSVQSQKPEKIEVAPRTYKHRFVVSMHKVRQWYPSENRHKVIWRGPYIKGPDGAPLLTGEKVRALVR